MRVSNVKDGSNGSVEEGSKGIDGGDVRNVCIADKGAMVVVVVLLFTMPFCSKVPS